MTGYHDRGSGPAVVVLPGLAATAGTVRPILDGLGEDHRVVTVELPGHGAHRATAAPPGLSAAVEHLHTVVTALGLRRFVLLGWSLGATVAYRYLESHGDHDVAGLVSVEQSPCLVTDGTWPYAAFGTLDPAAAGGLAGSIVDDYGGFAETLVRGCFAADSAPAPALVDALVAEARRCTPTAVQALFTDAVTDDWRARISAIRVPTLLIHGARSQVYPSGVGRWLAGAVPAARLAMFPHSGHLPFIEERARFLRTVREFVASTARASRPHTIGATMPDATTPTPRRLSWIYPDRGTGWMRQAEEDAVWGPYRKVAADLGLEMTVNKPEEVAVDATDAAQPVVYLNGDVVTPADTIFVTSLYSLPHQISDVVNQLFLFTILERAGFYLPIPPRLSYIGEDKAATVLHLAGCPVPLLPTVRVGSGREAMSGHYDAAFAKLSYPMIVKPAYWGMGLGVSVVHNVHDLRGVIGLAGGSDTAMVAQPYLPGVYERRAYVINGRTHTVLQGVKDGYCLMSTKALGGRHERGYADLPPELSDAVAYVAARVPTPYFALDFLFDGERHVISEIELDGAVAFNGDPEQDRVATSIVRDRFAAYAAGHASWLADPRPSGDA
jgi:pimeloyl-ACP methyl ester carboxylesterase